ncbi:hypothetical protein BLNAU_19770 [Blattamonas nauphoetae]|uniref:Uncharacterized protein n=1 Tax=Blattamonas nauphoetae TaxID=2049346 RepID=A0ABQ9X312_9EUKA|nr:hypothetical protein BLNAU_19770 [Blattamonas nauphoetae]
MKRKLPRERDDESPGSCTSSHIDWAAGSMDPFDYFKAPSLTLIPSRNTTSPHFMSYHTPEPPFHRKEVIPELHHPLVHSSISPQNASSQASSENTLAPSAPTTSTEIHFDKPNNVVLTNTNTTARTSTSSADDTDDESSFDWGSRGGSGGLDSHDEFEEIKTRLAKNNTETNKSAAPSLSSSIQPRATFHQAIPSLTYEDSGMVGSIQEVLGIDKDRTRTRMKEAVPVCLRRGQTAEFRLFKFSSLSELPPSLVSTHSPS